MEGKAPRAGRGMGAAGVGVEATTSDVEGGAVTGRPAGGAVAAGTEAVVAGATEP